MKIVNMTPHIITEVTTGHTFPPSGSVARVSVQSQQIGKTVSDIPLFATKFGDVVGLPAPEYGTMIIVSGMVFDASNRCDLMAPGDLVRDDNGNPAGCMGFRIKIP